MIIKIEVEDGIEENHAIAALTRLSEMYLAAGDTQYHHSVYRLNARITQISKAGNIFIKVTKA